MHKLYRNIETPERIANENYYRNFVSIFTSFAHCARIWSLFLFLCFSSLPLVFYHFRLFELFFSFCLCSVAFSLLAQTASASRQTNDNKLTPTVKTKHAQSKWECKNGILDFRLFKEEKTSSPLVFFAHTQKRSAEQSKTHNATIIKRTLTSDRCMRNSFNDCVIILFNAIRAYFIQIYFARLNVCAAEWTGVKSKFNSIIEVLKTKSLYLYWVVKWWITVCLKVCECFLQLSLKRKTFGRRWNRNSDLNGLQVSPVAISFSKKPT